MKNPDPEPSVVSTRTTAGNAAPMTSSSDAAGPAAGVGAGTGGAAAGTRTIGERGGAAGVGDGALGSTVSTAAGRAGCDTTGTAIAAGLTGLALRPFIQYATPAIDAIATITTIAVRVRLLSSDSGADAIASGGDANAAASSASRTWPQRHVDTRDGTRRSHDGHFQLNAGEEGCSTISKICVGRGAQTYGYRSIEARASVSRRPTKTSVQACRRSLRYSFNNGAQPGRCFS